jgi:dipeptidyl aminopeptidase/acylaminoacyl peptidase
MRRGALKFAPACFLLFTAAAAPPPPHRMSIDDVMTLRSVSDSRLSPDGRSVVFTVTEADQNANRDTSNLWIAPATGGQPVGLTHQTAKNDHARWSPDGRWIAFLSDRDSTDDKGQRVERRAEVWLLPVGQGEARQVTRSPTAVTDFDWAPDSGRLVCVSTAVRPDDEERQRRIKQGFDIIIAGESEMSHLWTIDVATGATRTLTSEWHSTEPAWSPKGDLIAFVARPTSGANEDLLSDLYAVSASGGTPRQLVWNEGPDFAPAWSPDGSQLAYLSNDRRQSSGAHNTIKVVASSGGTPRGVLQGFEYSAGRMRWSPDARTIYFATGTRTESHVFSVPAAGGPATQITKGPTVDQTFDLSADGRRLVFVREDAHTAGDLWISNVDGSGAARMTQQNPQLADLRLADSEVIHWKGADDWDIEGILVKPLDYKAGQRYPLIVEAHGGPHGRQSVGFNPMWQLFAAHGFVVLAPNFRGSGDYSQPFVDADRNDWGGKDYIDIMKGVDSVVAAGLADPDRMGIEGWSYGGFMTSWIIGHNTRFKAAVVGAGVTNLQSFYGTTDIQRFIEWEYGIPWQHTDSIREHSPITYATNAKTPTLILHGSADERVPVEQGQQLYMALKKSGVTVEFVRYPREGHGFKEPNHKRDRYQRYIDWFQRFLQPSITSSSK